MPGSAARRAAVGEGFFEVFHDVGELVDFFVEAAEEIGCRRIVAGVGKFFRTGSCARDLRRREKFRVGRPRAESDAAGEAFEI